MGVVVLNRDTGDALKRERILRREVSRMKIVSDHPGLNIKEVAEVFDAAYERPVRSLIVEIADVMAEKGLVAVGQAEDVLHLAAAGKGRCGHRLIQPNGERDVAARAANRQLTPQHHSYHRVVAPHLNGPVMQEHIIGDSC